MMKIAGRILIILLAALIVVGVTVALTRLSSSSAQPHAPGGPLVMLLSSPFVRDVLPGQWDHLAGNRYINTINNLEKIVIVAAIVIAISLVIDRIKRARRERRTPRT